MDISTLNKVNELVRAHFKKDDRMVEETQKPPTTSYRSKYKDFEDSLTSEELELFQKEVWERYQRELRKKGYVKTEDEIKEEVMERWKKS